MATKSDCICEYEPDPQDAVDGKLRPPIHKYNPKCRFHKGPDRGYGYDKWGQPNSKYSDAVGTILTGVFAGGVALGILYLILKALLEW